LIHRRLGEKRGRDRCQQPDFAPILRAGNWHRRRPDSAGPRRIPPYWIRRGPPGPSAFTRQR
jgi:hypothetical protein